MFYDIDKDGSYKSVDPLIMAAIIRDVNPAVISVRTPCGDELTITNVSIDRRANGVHILLDCPEACREED